MVYGLRVDRAGTATRLGGLVGLRGSVIGCARARLPGEAHRLFVLEHSEGAKIVRLRQTETHDFRTADTSFAARKNGIGRRRNSRKVQKIHGLSKDWDVQDAAPYFLGSSYNFSRPVRALRERGLDGRSQPRALAVAAGPAERVWAMAEWATYPGAPP
ncbi:MAG: hypothetical protein ACUVYA_12685 [Planctomycetota bacterium]